MLFKRSSKFFQDVSNGTVAYLRVIEDTTAAHALYVGQ